MADDTLDSDEESKNFQSAYLGGDRTALWNAIVFCAVHRIAHWEWLAAHIETTHHAAESGMIATWDDVFGRHPWARDSNAARKRIRADLRSGTRCMTLGWPVSRLTGRYMRKSAAS